MKQNKDKKAAILEKYSGLKLFNAKNPVILSGYRSLRKPFHYRATCNIMFIINSRAYYVRTSKLMSDVIAKAKANPQLLKKHI